MRRRTRAEPTPSIVTLGEMAALFDDAGLTMLEVSCNCCDRRGRVSIACLLAEHGRALPGPLLRRILAADCPRMIAGRVPDVCGVHSPQMARLPSPPR